MTVRHAAPAGTFLPTHPVERDPRFAALAERIAARLRPRCGHLAPEIFHQLVIDIACFRLRWTGDQAAAAPDEEREPAIDVGAWPTELDPGRVRGRGSHAVLLAAVDAAIRLGGADMGDAQLLDPACGVLRLDAQRGFHEPFLEYFATVRAGENACGAALRDGRPVIVEDVESGPLFAGTPAREVMLDAGSRAVYSTPLIAPSGRALGMLSVHYRRRHRPSDVDVRVLGLVAERASRLLEWTTAGPSAT